MYTAWWPLGAAPPESMHVETDGMEPRRSLSGMVLIPSDSHLPYMKDPPLYDVFFQYYPLLNYGFWEVFWMMVPFPFWWVAKVGCLWTRPEVLVQTRHCISSSFHCDLPGDELRKRETMQKIKGQKREGKGRWRCNRLNSLPNSLAWHTCLRRNTLFFSRKRYLIVRHLSQ